MRHHYSDIRDRINELPMWFDEHGVPRYGAFSPDRLSNIYAREAALAEISCQSCGRPFNVAMDNTYAGKGRGLCDEIRLGRLHYGDPPNTRCCATGATMNSVMHRVLEYWLHDLEIHSGWQRDPAFEGPVTQVYEPADTVSDVLAAVELGEAAIRVVCTSNPNRYDLAGRIAAAMAVKGPVLVACPRHLSFIARKMLDGLVPDNAVGNVKQACSVTIAPFEHLPKVSPGAMGTIIILSAAPPSERVVQSMKEADEELWHQTASWLESGAAGRVLIEFALAGRRRVIESPGVVIDGWQTKARTA